MLAGVASVAGVLLAAALLGCSISVDYRPRGAVVAPPDSGQAALTRAAALDNAPPLVAPATAPATPSPADLTTAVRAPATATPAGASVPAETVPEADQAPPDAEPAAIPAGTPGVPGTLGTPAAALAALPNVTSVPAVPATSAAPPSASPAGETFVVLPPRSPLLLAGSDDPICNTERLAPLIPPLDAPPDQLVRRPLLVQIDNAIPARPPLHLSDAAVVYESVAEGGVTRFSALFTRDDLGAVGPVRSARLISIEVARQFEALLVYHGASTGVQNAIWDGGIKWVSFLVPDTAPIQSRLGDRPAPHNSITWLPRVRAYAEAQGIASEIAAGRDFPRGDAPAAPDSGAALHLAVGFANPQGAPFAGYQAEFAYDAATNRYRRSIGGVAHVDGATRAPVAPETVAVQVAPVVVTDIVEDILGSRSLDYQLIGAGQAHLMREGRRWDGCWYRPDPFALTQFVLPDGTPFRFGSGPAWVAVAMPNTPLRWSGG